MTTILHTAPSLLLINSPNIPHYGILAVEIYVQCTTRAQSCAQEVRNCVL